MCAGGRPVSNLRAEHGTAGERRRAALACSACASWHTPPRADTERTGRHAADTTDTRTHIGTHEQYTQTHTNTRNHTNTQTRANAFARKHAEAKARVLGCYTSNPR